MRKGRIKKIKITAPKPQNMTSRNERLIGFSSRRLVFVLPLAMAYPYQDRAVLTTLKLNLITEPKTILSGSRATINPHASDISFEAHFTVAQTNVPQ